MYKRTGWTLRCIAASAFFLAIPLTAQDSDFPVQLHAPILFKALTFDLSTSHRTQDTVILGILYQTSSRESQKSRDEILALTKNTFRQPGEGIMIRAIAIAFTTPGELARTIVRDRINALYVAPLPGTPIEAISGVTRRLKILSITGIPQYLSKGLSVSILKDGKQPSVVVNLPASHAEGARFDPRFLDLARIIR